MRCLILTKVVVNYVIFRKIMMSEIKRYTLEQEEKGYLKYNDLTKTYDDTGMGALVEEKERLEWEIWSSQRDLNRVLDKIVALKIDLGI